MALSPTTRVAIHFQAYGRLPKVLVLIFDDHLLYRNGKERIMVDSLSRKGRLSHRPGIPGIRFMTCFVCFLRPCIWIGIWIRIECNALIAKPTSRADARIGGMP
ncbi:hypothetical protein ACOSQ2_003236 [Xanthoceras sorbifolium]